MKRSILILIITYFSLFIAQIFAQDLSKGLRYIELYQYKHAKGFFINSIKQNPKNQMTWLYLGDVYLALENTDSAKACYNKGIEVKPDDPYNYAGLAGLQFYLKNETDAKANIEKALKIIRNTKDAKFYLYLADVYFHNSKFDKALMYLDKAKEINKTLPEIYVKRGDVFMADNRAGDAANEYDRALFYNKNYVKAYYENGKIYVLAWNYEEALKAFQNVIKLDSNYVPVYKDLGELYYRANKNKLAADAYAKYIAMAEITPTDIARYAQMLYFSKNYAKSSEFIDRYLKVDSNNFVLLRILSYNSYELGDFAKGLKAIEKMLSLTNDENKLITSDYEYYAKLLAKNNRDSLAIINYLQVIKMDSTRSYYYEDIAKSYEKLNKYQKAAEYYKKHIDIRKTPSANDLYLYGKTCYIVITDPSNPIDTVTKRKYANKADSAFTKVSELLPDQYYGYIYRARVGSVMDPEVDKGLAKPFYEQALTIMEKTPDKFKKEIIESYEYMGFYFFVKKDYNTSETYWKKIQAIDPENAKAKEALEGIRKMRMKVKPKPQ